MSTTQLSLRQVTRAEGYQNAMSCLQSMEAMITASIRPRAEWKKDLTQVKSLCQAYEMFGDDSLKVSALKRKLAAIREKIQQLASTSSQESPDLSKSEVSLLTTLITLPKNVANERAERSFPDLLKYEKHAQILEQLDKILEKATSDQELAKDVKRLPSWLQQEIYSLHRDQYKKSAKKDLKKSCSQQRIW